MRFYCEEAEAVLRDVDSTSEGLTGAEAEKRLAANGKNKLAEGKKDSLIKRFFQQMGDPMIIILLVAAAISGVLAVVEGESFADVIIILAVVIINAVLGVYQRARRKRPSKLCSRCRRRRPRCCVTGRWSPSTARILSLATW